MSAGYSDIQGSSKASDEQKFNVLGRIDAEINSHINFQAKFNYSNVSNIRVINHLSILSTMLIPLAARCLFIMKTVLII